MEQVQLPMQFKKNNGRLIVFSSIILFRSVSLYVGFAILAVLSIIILAITKLVLDSLNTADGDGGLITSNSVFSIIIMFYWIVYGAVFIMVVSALTIILYKNEYAQDTFSLTVGSELSRTSIFFEKMAALSIFSIAIGFITCTLPMLLFSAACPQYASIVLERTGYMFLTIIIAYLCVSALITLFSFGCNSIGLWFIVSIMMVSGIMPVITGTVFMVKDSFSTFFGGENPVNALNNVYSNQYLDKKKGLDIVKNFNPDDYALQYYMMDNGFNMSSPAGTLGPDDKNHVFEPYLDVANWTNADFADVFKSHKKASLSYSGNNAEFNTMISSLNSDYKNYIETKPNVEYSTAFMDMLQLAAKDVDKMVNASSGSFDQITKILSQQKFTLNYTFNDFLNKKIGNMNNGFANIFSDFVGNDGIDFSVVSDKKANASVDKSLDLLKSKNANAYSLLSKYYQVNPEQKAVSLSDLGYITDYPMEMGDSALYNSNFSKRFITYLFENMVGDNLASTSASSSFDFDDFKTDFAHFFMYKADHIAGSISFMANVLLGQIDRFPDKFFENIYVTGPLANLVNYVKLINRKMMSVRSSASVLGFEINSDDVYNKQLDALDTYGHDAKLINFLSVWNQFDMMIDPNPVFSPTQSLFNIDNFEISRNSFSEIDNKDFAFDNADINDHAKLLVKELNQKWSQDNFKSYNIKPYSLIVQYWGLYVTYIVIAGLLTLLSWTLFNKRDLN